MSQPDLLTLTVATCAAAVVTGFLRNAVGGGIGLTLTPLLTLFLPPSLVLAMLGLLLLATDPISLGLYWKRWDRGEARRLIPTALVGVLLGGWLVASQSPAGLRRTIGAAALPFLYLGSWFGYRLNARLPRRAIALALLGFAFASALRLLLS